MLETTAPSSSRDRVALPGGKAGSLSLGAFSRGSRALNLMILLGPNWKLRLFCPVRGCAVECEEISPVLTLEVAEQLRTKLLEGENQH